MTIKNFTPKEALYSKTAEDNGIDNTPESFEIMSNIIHSAYCIQEVRDKILKQPISVNSWYRCEKLNNILPGASKTSDHRKGHAIDFTCKKFGTTAEIYEAIKHSSISYDQLIHEKKSKNGKPILWIHISFNPGRDRRQCLDLS